MMDGWICHRQRYRGDLFKNNKGKRFEEVVTSVAFGEGRRSGMGIDSGT